MELFRPAYTFDDVSLVPQYNNVPSRTEPDLTTWLTSKTSVASPLVPANMDTVIGDDLADVVLSYGGYPIMHRFTDFETQQKWVEKYGDRCYVSCGTNDAEKVAELVSGCRGVCIDIAHAHSEAVREFMTHLRSLIGSEKEMIVGNVCTAMGYQDLVNWGADAVKVGIGGGAICTTRKVTGFGTPQFTAVYECGQVARKLRVPIIADGGIRGSDDIAKALAAGASTVMCGSIFSNTFESAAPKFERDGKTFMKYRGQASEDFQNEFYGGVKKGTVPEGVSFEREVTEHASDVVEKLHGGLRSAYTYGGSRSIKEFQRKAEFRTVMPSYKAESNPRPNQ